MREKNALTRGNKNDLVLSAGTSSANSPPLLPMKTSVSPRAPRLVALLALAFASLTVSNLSAQTTVTTAPVGAIQTGVAASSDQRFGLTLLRPAVYSGVLENATGNVLTKTSTIPSLGTSTSYVRFTSGSKAGQWTQIVSSTANSITLTDSLTTLGVAVGDKFEVRPFWTLSTLFPPSSGFPESLDPGSPAATVLLNNPQATGVNIASDASFLYFSGNWYNANTFDLADNQIINPEVSLIVRNGTGASKSLVSIGEVPAVKVSTTVVARAAGSQDNQISNPYPAPLTLSTAGLVTSGAVRETLDPGSPVDVVFLYSSASVGINGASIAGYLYFGGNWYDANTFDPADSVVIPAGAAITIRRSGGTNISSEWNPSLPYAL